MNESRMDIPDIPSKMVIGFDEGHCNLKCPKCSVHGDGGNRDKIIKGKMDKERISLLLDELQHKNVTLSPNTYYDPLIQKDESGGKLTLNFDSSSAMILSAGIIQLVSAKNSGDDGKISLSAEQGMNF